MIIHITGPAGSGKTTLARALHSCTKSRILDGRNGNFAGLAVDFQVALATGDSPGGRYTAIRVDPANGTPVTEFVVTGPQWAKQAAMSIVAAYPILAISQ